MIYVQLKNRVTKTYTEVIMKKITIKRVGFEKH